MYPVDVTGRSLFPTPHDPSPGPAPNPQSKQAQIIALCMQKSLASVAETTDQTTLEQDQQTLSQLQKSPHVFGRFGDPALFAAQCRVNQDQNKVNADNATIDTDSLKINVLSGDTELYDTSGTDANEPALSDIHQGQYGDCYFLSALGSVAQDDPQAIKNMIHDNGDGTYTVTLYQQQSWPLNVVNQYKPVQVTVNAADIPYGAADETGSPDGQAIDSSNGKQVLWVSVVEAAYAKLHDDHFAGLDLGLQSGYDSIGGGGLAAGPMSTLTGKPATDISTDSMQGLNTLLQLSADFKAGDMINVSTDHSDKLPYNLVGAHSYTVTNIYTKDGIQYVSLNNPWGVNQPDDIPLSALPGVSNFLDVGKA